jgi:hypothetical protein
MAVTGMSAWNQDSAVTVPPQRMRDPERNERLGGPKQEARKRPRGFRGASSLYPTRAISGSAPGPALPESPDTDPYHRHRA